MRDRLFSLRDIDSGEKYTVSMLVIQALFLGIFIGAFDIGAHSLFLSAFDEKVLAKGYIVSGFAGLALLTLYFLFRSLARSAVFFQYSLLAVGLVTFLTWAAVSFLHSGWVLFAAFTLFFPLNMIAVTGFRAYIAAVISVKSGIRIRSLSSTFLILGIVTGCLLVSLLVSLKSSLNNVLLLSAVAVLLSTGLQLTLGTKSMQGYSSNDNQSVDFRRILTVFSILRVDGYARLLAVLSLLSVAAAFFIQYSFLAVTRAKFTSGEEIACFLGIFTGSLMLAALASKLLLFPRILKNYGLKITLLVSPVLLAAVTLVVITAGMVLGYTKESAAGFTVFFVLLAILRFFSRGLEESVDSPSLKLLSQPVNEGFRSEVNTVLDSAVREAGILLAGLLLAGAGMLTFVGIIHFSWFLILLLLAWLYVALRLFSEYRNSIKKGLEPQGKAVPVSDTASPSVSFTNRFYGERAFRLDYYHLISGDYSFLEKSDNKYYLQKIIDYAKQRKDINLVAAVRKMTSSHFDSEIRKKASDFIKSSDVPSSDRGKDDERIMAAKRVLSETRMPQTTEILRLLRDKSIESKKLAIYLIGKFKLSDMLTEVCECLNIQGLEVDTAAVLASFGSAAEEELIRFYLVSSGNLTASKTILRLLSKLTLNEGTAFLFSRLWSNSRQLKEVALQCLAESKFKPSAEDRERLNMLISEIVGTITWNISARRNLEKNNDQVILAEMNKELDRWNIFLLNLLSIAYDPAVVAKIKRYLANESVESAHYAQAIIDICFDEAIKEKIIYLLDIVPDEEKLKNLNRFFPVEMPDHNGLLEEILNRDYNLLSIWTKACVLRNMPELGNSEMSESVVALLFSPENILQEEAVRLIARSNISLYRSVYNRIPLQVRKNLDRIIEGEMDRRELLFERVLFLSAFFEVPAEDEMIFLARKLSFHADLRETAYSLPDGFIVWVMEQGKEANQAQIVYSSHVEELMETVSLADKTSAYMISFRALDEFLYQYPGYEKDVISRIENSERQTLDRM